MGHTPLGAKSSTGNLKWDLRLATAIHCMVLPAKVLYSPVEPTLFCLQESDEPEKGLKRRTKNEGYACKTLTHGRRFLSKHP